MSAGPERVGARSGRRPTVSGQHGAERAALLIHVSADGAEWIHDVIAERAPHAVICPDPFHAVAWASDALEKLRRRLAALLCAAGQDWQAFTIKYTR